MLYERWQQVARERGREMALVERATGRQWRFADLARIADGSSKPTESILYPQGHSAEFVLTLLRAWRWQTIACPLEPGQEPPKVPVPPSPCVHLKTTSATTGAPRVVAFTGPQLAADAENIMATMGLRPEWPNLGVISMAHSYGFSNLVLPLLLHGVPLLLAAGSLPEAVRRAAAGEPAITLAGVPALWRAWHEANALPENVRLAISAGAPLPTDLERDVFEASRLKIHNFYGSTECGGITYDATATPRGDQACVGTPTRNVVLTLNDDGCARVQSRAVGQTYWPEPAESLGAGCFQTGDLAELKDGFVYLRGRLSDQINVAGRKLSPETIEGALRSHPLVCDCVVFGVPSSERDRNEIIVAAVAAREPVSSETLRLFLLERLPAWQVPRQWLRLDSLEANRRGKISRAEWKQRFLLDHKTPLSGGLFKTR